MSGNILGTSFASGGFRFDPNISPNNQSFAAAVLAVLRRTGGGGGGGTGQSTPQMRAASFAGAPSITVPTNNVPIDIPFDCTLTQVTILTQGGTGTCTLDVWKTPFGSYPPSSANSIVGSTVPQITGGVAYQDNALTGWTTAFSAGDTLLVNLKTCSVFTQVTIFFELLPTSFVSNGYTNAQAVAALVAQLAAPTVKVSTTSTAGTSTFFMRADAAPAIDLAMSPSWTGNHSFAPVSGTAVKVTAPSGTYGVVVSGGTTTNQSFGLEVVAGSSASDIALQIVGNNAKLNLQVFGDGSGQVGASNFTWASSTGTNTLKGFGPGANALVDMTPDRVTSLATLTGAGIPAAAMGTASLVRNGKLVIAFIPVLTAAGTTSNNTVQINLPGLPAAFLPATTGNIVVAVTAAGTVAPGLISVSAASSVLPLLPAVSGGTFTGTLSRGLGQSSIIHWICAGQ